MKSAFFPAAGRGVRGPVGVGLRRPRQVALRRHGRAHRRVPGRGGEGRHGHGQPHRPPDEPARQPGTRFNYDYQQNHTYFLLKNKIKDS